MEQGGTKVGTCSRGQVPALPVQVRRWPAQAAVREVATPRERNRRAGAPGSAHSAVYFVAATVAATAITSAGFETFLLLTVNLPSFSSNVERSSPFSSL